jgi:hypothetical protein
LSGVGDGGQRGGGLVAVEEGGGRKRMWEGEYSASTAYTCM